MKGRILIAGTHSGCGKTTVTCAVLSALKARVPDVSGYKCGPDYIDPMFHREAIGIPSHNLDPFFSTGKQLRDMLANAEGVSVIEGVMGFYDGVGTDGRFSTFDVAAETETPVVLVIDANGMYNSAGAVLHGFRRYKQGGNIRGVIFNNISASVYQGLREVAKKEEVVPLGFLPRKPELSVGSRHLGLITANEIDNIKLNLHALGKLAEQHIDLDMLLDLAADAPAFVPRTPRAPSPPVVKIAVARDEAFCFLYQENLEMLRALGCETVPFSPLHDAKLPEKIGGLYLPGGYPELYLKGLSQNTRMLQTIRNVIACGLPTIAECGGFLYLHDKLDGYPMVGTIHADAYRTNQLRRFGYVTLTAKRDNLLCKAGETIRSHEFHYYESADGGSAFRADKPSGRSAWDCIHATEALYAGFPHLYFPANAGFAERFVGQAVRYAASKPGKNLT